MNLTDRSARTEALPDGKADHIIFDDKLSGFGLRIRAGGKRSWIVQYRFGTRQRRFAHQGEVRMRSKSHGRHGGNQGRTDPGEARNQRAAASVNTDTDSRRRGRDRDRDRTQGHTSGRK